MSHDNKNSAWSRPKLIIIARGQSEERVLYTCKHVESGNQQIACNAQGGAVNDIYCDVIEPS